MTTTINIETLLAWGAPKRVRTSKGERDMLKAAPTDLFYKLWKSDKAKLQELGLGWVKENDGSWCVVWWRLLGEAEAQAKAEAIEASKATDAEIAIPANPGLEYLGYQKAGVRYALGRDGTFIGDEMGLGKTIQAIGIINADKSIKNVLIVCPASIKLNWARELRKWLTRPMTIQLVGSGAGWGKADITIINFEMLNKFAAQVAANFDLAVIDESHRIKNPKAQCTKVATQIKATRRVAMTGTPILNRPIELWTSLLWLDPVRWHKKSSYFQKRYCGAFQGEWGWVNDGATHLEELQEVLRTSCMVRRLKKDVLTELPPKIRQVIELEGDANAKKAAKAELAKWQELQADIEDAAARKEAAQAAGDAEAFEDAVAELAEAQGVAFESMSLVRHETALAKVPMVLEFALEVLEEAPKIVIFAHHQDVVQAIMDGLSAYNPVKLVGGMSDTAKQVSIDTFQNDPDCRVFVGSTLAAGVGITLTAASHVIFAELDWTPARVSQAEDRCHRIGQLSSVLVQHLVLAESLDAYMAQMIVDKQRIADKALDKGAKAIEVKQAATEVTVTTLPEVTQGAVSQEKVAAAHQAMRILAGMCDGAQRLDNVGFNKMDTHLGKSLAAAHHLSPKQTAIAVRFATKYRRQLPTELVAAITGKG